MKTMYPKWLSGVFCIGLCILPMVLSTPSYADVGQIQSKLESGQTEAALRQADQLLSQVIALKIKAQSRLNQAEQALQTYEVLVGLTGKEDLTLLQEVGWAFVNKILQGTNRRAQQMLAEYLGTLKDRKAVAPLVALLKKSPDFVTKRYVVEALGLLQDEQAAPALSAEMKGRNFLVQTSAAWALAHIGNRDGEAMLRNCFKTMESAQKLRCAAMLARLKKKDVQSYLRNQLKTNDNRRAREVIARGLADLGDNSWIPVILKDLRSNLTETRFISARVLGELKATKTSRSLRSALRDSSELVKMTAARSLGMLGSKQGANVLKQALTDNKAQTRSSAAESLVDVKEEGLLETLQKTLSDKHLVVRVYAAHALAVLKRQDGGGVVREAWSRGNLPLQALATKVALELVRLGSSEGTPLQRMTGALFPAQEVKAFVDKSGEDEEDSGFQEDSSGKKVAPKSRTASGSKQPTAVRKAPQRRKPAGRGKKEDGDEDEW